MNKAIETVNDIKTKLVASNGASAADKEKYDTKSRRSSRSSRAMPTPRPSRGANWLSVDTTTGHTAAGTFDDVKIVSSFNRNAAGTVSLGTIDVKVQDIKLYDNAAASTGLTDGILDAVRLGTTGARQAAASAAVAGTDAATDTYTVATLSVKGFTDAQITKMITVTESALKEMTTPRPTSALPRPASTVRRPSPPR